MQFRSDWSAIWVYNPRNGILMQHGFEESGDVQDIRLVVDTIPTLAWSAGPDGSADFFNQRWLDYTGLSAEQALGSGWQVAIHPDESAHRRRLRYAEDHTLDSASVIVSCFTALYFAPVSS